MGRDFTPLKIGQPVFRMFNGKTIHLEDHPLFPSDLLELIRKGKKLAPLFIGEAAYLEKGIAFLTVKCPDNETPF